MANWAAISALGQAASGAGDYFGVVAADRKKADMLAQARAEKLADTAAANKREEDIYVRARADKKQDIKDEVEADATLRGVVHEENIERRADLRAEDVLDANAVDGGWSGETYTDQETGKVYNIDKRGEHSDTGRVEQTEFEKQMADWSEEERKEEREYQLGLTREAQEAQKDLEENGFDFTEAQAKLYIHYGNGMAGMTNADKALSEGPQGTFDNIIRQLGGGTLKDNWIQDGAAQRYENGMLEVAEALLRQKSGAALKADEILLEAKKYMIQAGDDVSTILQKRDAAQRAVDLIGDTLPKAAKERALGRVSTVDYSAKGAERGVTSAMDQVNASRAPLKSAAEVTPTLGLSASANKYLDL